MIDLSMYTDFGFITIPFSEMPIKSTHTLLIGDGITSTYIKLGDVKRGDNEPNCYIEEKQCANHICRVLNPTNTYLKAHVIRDDGTLWHISLDKFESVRYITIYDDRTTGNYYSRLIKWKIEGDKYYVGI